MKTMSSMKALERLKQRIICVKGEEEFNLLYKKYYDEIKQSLEVLEIFRKHFNIKFYNEELIMKIFVIYVPEEEQNKIKEWLGCKEK